MLLTVVFTGGGILCALQARRGLRGRTLWVDGDSLDPLVIEPRPVSGHAAKLLGSLYAIVGAGCLLAVVSVWR